VVRRRQAQRLVQLPRPPRRGRPGDKVAYHWEGEPGDTRTITYADLLDEVQRFANVLKGLGVEQGRPGQPSTCR
jgi:acyl-coenzyme A synthetase/AMP-(fatty) acid ligase